MSYYRGYTDNRAETDAFMPWYQASELVEFIKAAQRINFSLNEPRQQVMERFNGLRADAPYGPAKRFADGLWVNGGGGDWPRKFQQMRLALSLKEKDKDDKVRSDDRRVDTSDALVAYHNALTAMLDEIKMRDGLFSRATFEGFYGLDWTEQ